MHQFHASPRTNTVARPDDLEMIPLLPVPMGNAVNQAEWTLTATGMLTLTVRPGRYAQAAFRHVNGRRSLKDICRTVAKQFVERPSRNDVMAQFRSAYEAMNSWGDAVLLKHPSSMQA
jgi:hypothetical protein